jgi:formate-dependent nitrite reductase membrane component NrfD
MEYLSRRRFLKIGAATFGAGTGILLSTMVARPLWNSAILGPLFLLVLAGGFTLRWVMVGPARQATSSPQLDRRSGPLRLLS